LKENKYNIKMAEGAPVMAEVMNLLEAETSSA
jgi:hypothetical protein